jgi:hypothetical protein
MLLLLSLGFFCTCTPRTDRAQADAVFFGAVPLALLQAGENPLWFELAEDGPRRIDFPDEAELSPFAPWPLARHIRFILPLEDELILGVNRDGFLRLAPPEAAGENIGGIALYRVADAPYWGQYTLAALFPFEDRATALLYRDDFFAGPEPPLPSPRSFVLLPDAPAPRPRELPAFDRFPPAAGWDLDALRFGHDGRWYYRAVRKTAEAPEIAYYRTDALTSIGETISIGDFQNSALPEPLSAAPALLRSVLEAAFAQSPGNSIAAALIPGRNAPRYFSAPASSTKSSGTPAAAESGTPAAGIEIAGFYREPTADHPAAALALLPTGQAFFSSAPTNAATSAPGTPQPLTLPALPPGFAYTAAAPCGNALIVAWEEQKDYSIGAAGFMIINYPPAPDSGEQP